MFKRFLLLLMMGTLPIFAEPQFDLIGRIVFYLMVFIEKSMDYLAIPILIFTGFVVMRKIAKQKENKDT